MFQAVASQDSNSDSPPSMASAAAPLSTVP